MARWFINYWMQDGLRVKVASLEEGINSKDRRIADLVKCLEDKEKEVATLTKQKEDLLNRS